MPFINGIHTIKVCYNFNKIEKLYFVDFIGWAVLLVSKLLRINLDFNIKKIKKFILEVS